MRRLASWAATEKLHIKATHDGWQVGRKQKNQHIIVCKEVVREDSLFVCYWGKY